MGAGYLTEGCPELVLLNEALPALPAPAAGTRYRIVSASEDLQRVLVRHTSGQRGQSDGMYLVTPDGPTARVSSLDADASVVLSPSGKSILGARVYNKQDEQRLQLAIGSVDAILMDKYPVGAEADFSVRAGERQTTPPMPPLLSISRSEGLNLAVAVPSKSEAQKFHVGMFALRENPVPHFGEVGWFPDEVLPSLLHTGKREHLLTRTSIGSTLTPIHAVGTQFGTHVPSVAKHDGQRLLLLETSTDNEIRVTELDPDRATVSVPGFPSMQMSRGQQWTRQAFPHGTGNGRVFTAFVSQESEIFVWEPPSAHLGGARGRAWGPSVYLWNWKTAEIRPVSWNPAFPLNPGSLKSEAEVSAVLGDVTFALTLGRPAWNVQRSFLLAGTRDGTLLWFDLSAGRFLGESQVGEGRIFEMRANRAGDRLFILFDNGTFTYFDLRSDIRKFQ